MTARVLVLFVSACFLLAAFDGTSSSPAKSETPLERAASEFKIETEALGIRPGQAGSAVKTHAAKLVWHGRVFENFRNDVLDAVPHEIKQSGQDKSLLQRNQFGFNVSGPLVIPRVLSAHRNTFFSLSYEGVREDISRLDAPSRLAQILHVGRGLPSPARAPGASLLQSDRAGHNQ